MKNLILKFGPGLTILAGVLVPVLMQLGWVDDGTGAYIASVITALAGGTAQTVKPKTG
jgi:hypothetical protein